MPSIAELMVKVLGDTSDLDKKLKETTARLSQFGRQAEQIGANFAGLGARLTAGLTLPLGAIAKTSLQLSGALEQKKIAFETMLGSAERASAHLRELRDFAAKTPFQFTELVESSKRMQALGFAAEQVIPNLRAIGGAAAALGSGSEGINRITLALGQMQAKGKVTSEELKQLTEAGIPAWQMLAKILNTDVAGAMALVEKRAVNSAAAVPALISAINERFGGLLEKQSNTLLGRFSNLKDRLEEVATTIGDTLRPQAERTIAALQRIGDVAADAAKKFEGLPGPVKEATASLVAFFAVAGPVALVTGGIASSIANMAKIAARVVPALAGFRAAVAGFGISFSAASGIVALAGGIAYLLSKLSDTRKVDTTAEAVKRLNERFRESLQASGQLAKPTGAYDSVLNFVRGLDGQTAKAGTAKGALLDLGAAAEKSGKHIKTFGELLQDEQLGRYEAGLRTMAKAVLDTRTAFEPFGTKLELIGSKLPDQVLDFADLAEVMAATSAAAQSMPDLSALWSRSAEGAHTYEGILKQIGLTSQKSLDDEVSRLRALVGELENLNRLGVGTFEDVARAREKLAEAEKRAGEVSTRSTTKAKDAWEGFGRQVSLVVTDLSRGLAQVILAGESLGRTFEKIGKQIAESLTRYVIEEGLKRILKALDPLFDKLKDLGKQVGQILLGRTPGFGGGFPVPTSGGGGGGGGSIPTPGGVSTGASGAVGGVLGAIGAVGSVVGAISGVISNFQLARQETTLNAIELNTRKTTIFLGEQSDSILANIKAYLPAAKELRDYWIGGAGGTLQLRMTSLIEDIKYAVEKRLASSAAGVVINVTGASSPQQTAQEVARVLKQLGVVAG